jgi:hypothetical protein
MWNIVFVRALLFSLFVMNCVTLWSQDWNRYTPLAPEGEIPKEFLGPTSERYRVLKEEYAQTGTEFERQTKDDFLLQSSYAIDELMLSGKVLFNDPVSEYLNEIKDYLLESDPKLASQLKVYAVKSSMVNAFTTADGRIFFHMGLLSRMENEAQIAFVLCHEIQHYVHRDPMEGYIVTEEIKRDNKIIDRNQLEELLFKRNMFSQTQEKRADEEGRNLFLQSGYDLDSVIGLFDILQYGYLHFEEAVFDPNWLVGGNMVLHPERLAKQIKPINTEYVFDEKRSTHPSIPERRAAVQNEAELNRDREGKAFVINRGTFHRLVEMARFEVVGCLLEEHAYMEALHQCFLLDRRHPNSHYLGKAAAWSMYAMAKYKNAGHFDLVATDVDDAEGEFSQLVQILHNLESHELTLLAIRKAWQVHLADAEDREMVLVLNDLLKDWRSFHPDKAEILVTQAPTSQELHFARLSMDLAALGYPWKVDSVSRAQQKKLLNERYAALADKKANETQVVVPQLDSVLAIKDTNNYLRFCIADLIVLDAFQEWYVQKFDSVSNSEKSEQAALTWEDHETRLAQGRSLGLDNVVFVDPLYIRVDERKIMKMDYLGSEEKLTEFHKIIRDASDAVGLESTVINPHELGKSDIAQFNNLAVLRAWLHERLSHDEVDLVNIHSDEALAVKQQYGASAFCWIGAISVKDKRNKWEFIIPGLLSFAAPPFLGLVVLRAVTPARSGLFFTYVVDTEQEEVLDANWRSINTIDSKTLWKSIIYDTLLQMRTK